MTPTWKPACRKGLAKWLPKGGVGAEIGVREGKFSNILIRYARPRLFYCVDLWEPNTGIPLSVDHRNDAGWERSCRKTLQALRGYIAEGRVRILCGDSIQMASYVPDGSLDWVYIDADHGYDACTADMETWSQKVRTGGFVCGHDYVDDGVIFVKRAVDDFLARHGVSLEFITKEGPRSWCICKTWEPASALSDKEPA